VNANLIEGSTSQCQQQHQSLSHQQQLLYTLFFGTDYWLLFVRLHAILCERLAIIRNTTDELVEEYNVELQFQESQKQAYNKYGHSTESHHLNAVDVHLGLREMKKPMQNPENFYQVMLQEMKNFLDGTVNSEHFQDNLRYYLHSHLNIYFSQVSFSCRNMFHTKAYVLFTMDKLISKIAIHLKDFVSHKNSMKCVELFDNYHEKRNGIYLEGRLAKQANQEYESEAKKVSLHNFST
jgi:paired amphipathic helix protein Sin3a